MYRVLGIKRVVGSRAIAFLALILGCSGAAQATTYDISTDFSTAFNPNGVWTFNHLMTQMANQPASGIDPSIFVEQWLANWQAAQTINTHGVPAKLLVNNVILTPWPKRPDASNSRA